MLNGKVFTPVVEPKAGKVDHGLRELLPQRVFSIACGYPDANDSARLASDPIHKLLLDRDPVEGRNLASQPTLSRFENGVGVKELYRMGKALAVSVMRRHGKRLRHRACRVTIDLDPTDDPTHGSQQLSFFNGHYDNWCYLPVLGFVSFNEEAEQYLCAAVLRPGNVTAAVGAVGLLRRLVRIIRNRFPGVQIRVRLDGGFAHPAVLEFLDAQPPPIVDPGHTLRQGKMWLDPVPLRKPLIRSSVYDSRAVSCRISAMRQITDR
jgi:hypothetical protein